MYENNGGRHYWLYRLIVGTLNHSLDFGTARLLKRLGYGNSIL